MRLTRAQKQAQTRADLLEAAARVFARRGYASASVEEIAEEAGYSHGAVYSNFKGKAELFLAVFEDYMATRVQEVSERREATEGEFEQRAHAMADQWMERFARDRESFLLHLEFMVHAGRHPELSERFGVRAAALRLALERYIAAFEEREGVSLGLPPAELARVLRALGIGLAVEALHDPDGVRDGLYGDFVELVLRMLRERAAG